jgi:hypothetical protein
LLEKEIALVATPTARIIAVGSLVAEYLAQRGLRRPVTRVLHYSPQAAKARIHSIAGCEAAFEAFEGSISKGELVATTKDALRDAHVWDAGLQKEVLATVEKAKLTRARQRLLFIYKQAFEGVRSRGQLCS